MFRKILPYILFAALGLFMLTGHKLLESVTTWLYGATADSRPLELSKATYALAALGDSSATQAVRTAEALNAARLNATGAEVEAAHQAGGWVPSGTVASKYITFAGAYLLAVLLPWLVRHMTHPAPTKWAKEKYSKEFEQRPVEEKFAINSRIELINVIRAAAALVFAATVI